MPSTAPQYVRSITPAEWLYVAMRDANLIQHVIEGDGALSLVDITRAVEIAAQASPGVRLIRKGRKWVDSGVAPKVTVLDPAAFDRAALDSPALRTRLDGTTATVEVLLVPGSPYLMVLRGFHAVTDARGLLLWAGDVFRVLRGEAPLGAPSTLNSEEYLRELLPEGLPPIPPAAGKPEWPSILGPVPQRGRHGMLWRRRSIDGQHAAATAKIAAALTLLHGPGGRGRLFVPVDLRRHRPDIRSTAWLSQACVLQVEPGDQWEAVHRKLLTALGERREIELRTDPRMLRAPLPALRFLADAVGRQAQRQDRYSALAFLTHLGTVDLGALKAPGFEATTFYTLGGSGPGAPPAIELAEVAGRTEITVAWQEVPGASAAVESLLDDLEDALAPRAYRHWNGNLTQRALPTGDSLLKLFRDQVARTPDRVALSGPDGTVTYAELSRQADQIAAALRERGVGRGHIVGILADRSAEAIAGIWAVLRTGAAYLPLDVAHPDARLADLLGDASASHCLVQAPHDGRDCVPVGCVPLRLADILAGQADVPAQDADVRPDDLAYVIYTSGSTGRPKGVQIEHRALLNYLFWALEVFLVDENTRLPLLTSLSFDVSGTSIFAPAIVGGEVILVRDQPNHVTLRALLTESGATMLNLTPSHLDLIGRLDVRPTGFRSIVVVGEQLRVEVAARAQDMFGPECRIVNEYGPTEATIGCTAHTFDPATDTGTAVPIGVPAFNSTVFLLDSTRGFVPPGEPGEMYLGGVQLARGYLGRPDLDRERFHRLVDGTRVYRTGDLARILPSGELEYIGRIDDQVKVRGHRVEPAEVAQCLETYPGVERAVVVARARPDGNGKALYGYVLAKDGAVSPDEVAAHAALRLPAYMVPSAILVVESFPYTVSGKVDARALPDPFAGASGGGASSDAPADPLTAAVAGVWAQVLGLDAASVDAHTDFYRMGGDSLAFLSMLAGVCREVLDPARESAFMAELPRIIAGPTLDNVAGIAREVAAA